MLVRSVPLTIRVMARTTMPAKHRALNPQAYERFNASSINTEPAPAWGITFTKGQTFMFGLSKLLNRHRNANWVLADQSVVSGTNFITGVLLARFLGPEIFGLFVLLQAVILYVNSFQGALIFQQIGRAHV